MDFAENLFTIKDVLLENIFPQFQYIASCIGAITATILIVTITLNSYLTGDGIDWSMALRPFVIAFVLAVFPNLVVRPLDSISQATNKWMSSICDEAKNNKEALEEEIKRKIEEENKINTDEYTIADADPNQVNPTFEQNNSTTATSAEQNRPSWIARAFISIITWIVDVLTTVAQIFISFLSIMYLMILSLTGPITFALAILPAFKGGITSWFARYIQIMLWIPLSQIFMYMMYSVQNILLSESLGKSVVTSPVITMLALGVVSIIGMFKIPSIAEWVIESTGGQSFNAAVNKAGVAGSRAAGKGGLSLSKAVMAKFKK